MLLIIDHDLTMLTLLKHLLKEELGVETLIASSREEALKILAQDIIPVKVVIADLRMPGMSGVDLFNEIKLLYPHIHVVVVAKDSYASSKEPVKKFFSKYDIARLIPWLKKLLGFD